MTKELETDRKKSKADFDDFFCNLFTLISIICDEELIEKVYETAFCALTEDD